MTITDAMMQSTSNVGITTYRRTCQLLGWLASRSL